MRTIAIINQKGGCGKTTTAINLAGVFASMGQRALLVDLDPQSHCAAGLAIPEHRIDLHIGDAMLSAEDTPLDLSRLVWRVSRGLDLAPSTMRLAGLEAARGGLATLPDRDERLLHAIRRLTTDELTGMGKYDWCIVDCPPTIGLLTFNALRAASEVLIPVETSFFSMKGASKQVGTIRTLARRLGGATPHRLLATMHDPDSPLARTLLGELGERFEDRLIPVVIRLDPKLKEATSLGQPIIEHAPEAHGADDYGRLASWLMDNPPGRNAAAALLEAIADEDSPESVRRASQPADAVEVVAHRPSGVLPPIRPDDTDAPHTADEVVTRAAEMAARVRQLLQRSDKLQSRLTPDEQLISTSSRFDSSVMDEEGWRPGPNVIEGGVRFVMPGAPGQHVFVSGEFNGWSSSATPMRYDPVKRVYAAYVPMPPGRRLYRMVVNGLWRADPNNPEVEENPFGDRNSVLIVRPVSPGSFATPA